jgi:SAM-dependent methyltransferase
MSFHCRFCNTLLKNTFVDLGSTPLANSYLPTADAPDQSYPLHVYVCSKCYLVQLHHTVSPENIFGHYAYFSSYSSSWLEHATRFCDKMKKRLSLNSSSKVVEIASNDGYLLKNFVAANIPCLGVEPAKNVAEVAIANGVPTEVVFFGKASAQALKDKGHAADLIAANNVLAHVPDLNDFVGGFKVLLKPDGVISVECPHLLKLIQQNQFDTIYHEHYSYYSLLTLEKIFAAHGLEIFDVEELPTHGGSLRIFASHAGKPRWPSSPAFAKVKQDEKHAMLDSLAGYEGFSKQVKTVCDGLLTFLKQEKTKGKKIAAYGAAAKGNTLLNVCGINTDLISFVVDKNTAKQNHFLPGSKIPIFGPEKVFAEKPDYLVILPWNIAEEVREQMKDIRSWGGKFVTAIPQLRVYE